MSVYEEYSKAEEEMLKVSQVLFFANPNADSVLEIFVRRGPKVQKALSLGHNYESPD
jgi:hypothetical protein